MAGDDSRAQVQLDEDTLARRVLGRRPPDTQGSAGLANLLSLNFFADPTEGFRRLAAAAPPGPGREKTVAFLRALGEHQAARELNEDEPG